MYDKYDRIFACNSCKTVDRVGYEDQDSNKLLEEARKKHLAISPSCSQEDIFFPPMGLLEGILRPILDALKRIQGRAV